MKFRQPTSRRSAAVMKLPAVLQGELVAAINMLDVERHYAPQCVAAAEALPALPAKLCNALADLFDTRARIPD